MLAALKQKGVIKLHPYVNDVTDIHEVSIGAELAWATVT